MKTPTIAARLEAMFGQSPKRQKRAMVKLGFSYDCDRCSGTGKIRAFSHIENGGCFACGAQGRMAVKATRQNIDAIELAYAFTKAPLSMTWGARTLVANAYKLRNPAGYGAGLVVKH